MKKYIIHNFLEKLRPIQITASASAVDFKFILLQQKYLGLQGTLFSN